MTFALFRLFHSLMEALGRMRSHVRTAILEFPLQDLHAVWFAKIFPQFIQQPGLNGENSSISSCVIFSFLGLLDKPTIAKLNQERCGVKDPSIKKHVTGRRQKRYTLQGTKWPLDKYPKVRLQILRLGGHN